MVSLAFQACTTNKETSSKSLSNKIDIDKSIMDLI